MGRGVPVGRQMPPGHVLALLLLGLECLELDVEIGPALDPCWSPTPTLPLARFPGCVPAQEPVPGNSLTYKPRDQAVQNLGRPESDSWRWLLEGPPCSQPGWVVRSQASGSRRCHTRNPNRILKQEVRAWLGVGVTLESVKENVACNPLGLSG